MANSRRRPAASLIVVLSVVCGAGTAAAGPQPGLTVALLVQDYASVPERDLAVALAYAARIYAAIGVNIEWIESGTAAGALVLLPREMTEKKCAAENIPAGVLGRGSATTGRAYVFHERVSRVARNAGADDRVMLGKIIAHELGHLLLPEQSHSPNGIMRAQLDPRPTVERFTPAQADAIRTALAARGAGL